MSLQGLVKELVAMAEKTPPPSAMPASNSAAAAEPALDVIIVGAGAAGVGCALMLTKTFGLDASRVLLIERGETVGDTFRRWPEEMRFISPSFNQQGWTASFDLNSIAYGTSPAYSLHAEHPSGDEYADYLNALARDAKLCVRTQTEVVSVQAEGVKGGPPLFSVGLSRAEPGSRRTGPTGATETLAARYVVWAAGEFQYPAEAESAGAVVGAELCMHNSRVPSWAGLPGDDFVVIGGYVVSARPLSPTPDRSHNSFSTSQRSTSSDLPWLSTSLPCETAQRLHSHTLHLVPLH
jgi:cation diffusion facilitator CzcD-associated flavoprotein CzcO